MRRMRILSLLAGLLLLAAPASWGADRILVDQVRLAVDDLVMTDREVRAMMELEARQLREQFDGEALEQRLQSLEDNILERLTVDLLLENKARQLGISVDEEQIDERVDTIVSRQPAVAENYTDQELKSFILKDILKRRVIQQEVAAHIHITEREIREACRKVESEAREVHVGHILVRGQDEEARQRIRALRGELEAGADFRELAAEHSQDPSVSQNRGDLGFISRGQFVAPFEEAAFALEPGEVSGPVETRFGYHLIKVFEERSEASVDCDDMDDVTRNRSRDRLFQSKREERMNEYIARLRENAEVRVFDRPGYVGTP